MTETDPRKVANALTEAQRQIILSAQIEDWPGRSAIYMARYTAASDALALWRHKLLGEYTNMEEWFSPLTDLGNVVRTILQEQQP